MSSEKILDISWGTLWKIFVAALLLYILYQIRDILIWFLFALIISLLFNPAINFLKKIKIHRSLAVSVAYLGFFGILILLAYLVIPFFISEIRQFSQNLPQYFEEISPPLRELGIRAFEDLDIFINTLSGTLEKIGGNVFNFIFIIFGGIFSTIFTLTLSIYLSLAEKGIEKTLTLLFPKKYDAYISSLWEKCQKKVSGWFLSRVLACLFVGIISFITFLLFDTPFPISLAVLSGLFNFIPVVGPTVAGILIFVIVAVEDLTKGIFVLIASILIQQIENNILTPVLSKKFVGLPPVLVLLSLAIGGVLWGFLGAVLAIPLAGILYEFLKEFLEKRKTENTVIL